MGGLWSEYLNTGARYNPTTDTWTTISTINAPSGRAGHTAIWTGSEMIIWGGQTAFGDNYTDTGARYDPATDSWTTVTTNNAPSVRAGHFFVWTGTEMIIWRGNGSSGTTNTGARYDPMTDS
jgi:N-acetylneuraminic acid mutarotase